MSTIMAILTVLLPMAACVIIPIWMKKKGKGKNTFMRILAGVGIAFGLFIFLMILSSVFMTDEERAEQHVRDSIREVERMEKQHIKDSIAAEEARVADSIAEAMSKSHWIERTSEDAMTDATNVWMSLLSDNQHEFEFPYNGGAKLQIDVRYRKQDGSQVILTLSKGQLQTTNYSNGNNVIVRFDDDAPMTFSTSEPADYSSSYLFLNNPRKFINRAKTAKKIKVQVPVFDEGQPVFEFEPAEPLKWDY